MRLKRMLGDRIEVWRWSRRRGELRQALLLLVLVFSLVLLRNFEIHDLREERDAALAELATLKAGSAFGALPPVVFMFSADSVEQLDYRLAMLGNMIDRERMSLRKGKK